MRPKPEDTEVWSPEPKIIAAELNAPPSDAVVLFDGKNLDAWVMTNDRTKPASWSVVNGEMTVSKATGNIETKQAFGNYQFHLEWKVPVNIIGEGQSRGNGGIFLASIGRGDAGYELQVLDSYNNKTYVNGQAGAVYKQAPPLVNPNRKPGEWQSFDIIWTAPVFNEDGTLKSAARVTALLNGVVVQNNFELLGPTQYIGKPGYKQAHAAKSPIKLQSHGDPSSPLSFRNIWVREL